MPGQDSTKQTTPAFPHTPPPSSTSPQSRDEHFPGHQLPQSTFKGLEEHMSQGSNPFEQQSIPQAILGSNVQRSSSAHQQQPPTPTGRPFAPIAPDPVGLQRMQAVRQSQEVEEGQQSKKRRLTNPTMEAPAPPPLKDEDKLLLQLKDEQQLPWKNIVSRFQQETGKVHAIAALQMRYKRLKDRLQVWTDPDIEALKQAHEYWESRKFDIISAKVCVFTTSRDSKILWNSLWSSSRQAGNCVQCRFARIIAEKYVANFEVLDARVRRYREILRTCLSPQMARITSGGRTVHAPSAIHASSAWLPSFIVFTTASATFFCLRSFATNFQFFTLTEPTNQSLPRFCCLAIIHRISKSTTLTHFLPSAYTAYIRSTKLRPLCTSVAVSTTVQSQSHTAGAPTASPTVQLHNAQSPATIIELPTDKCDSRRAAGPAARPRRLLALMR